MDLRLVSASNPQFPPIIFVYPARPDEGDAFFNQYFPNASAIGDPQGQLYQAFGLEHASLSQMIGIKPLLSGFRAARKGHHVGKIVGDYKLLSGFFLIDSHRQNPPAIIWSHLSTHAGDHPSWEKIADYNP